MMDLTTPVCDLSTLYFILWLYDDVFCGIFDKLLKNLLTEREFHEVFDKLLDTLGITSPFFLVVQVWTY